MLRVRVVAVAVSGVALLGCVSSAAASKPGKLPATPVELVTLNHHEVFVLRPDGGGRLSKGQLKGWNEFLRCHHTGRKHAMSQRLAELLYKVAKHFEFRRLEVVAGYRAPKVAREKGNPKSPHKKGLACDFRVAGVPNETVRDYVRGEFEHVGVGYYPNSGFIHLDVRDGASAFWVDLSAPGERAKYSRNPVEEVQQGDAAARAAAMLPEPEGGADEE